MDRLSLVGLIIAIAAIYLGFYLDGGGFGTLFELPAFIIVFGGTLGAVMLQSSQVQFLHAVSLLKWVFYPPNYNVEQGMEKILHWAEKSRGAGYLALEDEALIEEEIYTYKAVNLLVDGIDIEQLKVALDLELDLHREHNLRSANVFESMGGYSPTIGILGAVLGLIHAMGNLTNPSMLGQGIATAFIATIYGVGFANLIYLPIANKIRAVVHQQTLYREMICEGIIAIALGESPHAIENKLSAYLLK